MILGVNCLHFLKLECYDLQSKKVGQRFSSLLTLLGKDGRVSAFILERFVGFGEKNSLFHETKEFQFIVLYGQTKNQGQESKG